MSVRLKTLFLVAFFVVVTLLIVGTYQELMANPVVQQGSLFSAMTLEVSPDLVVSGRFGTLKDRSFNLAYPYPYPYSNLVVGNPYIPLPILVERLPYR